ncbi:MAG: hypothetical protein RI911_42 [Candidatus Parcubacteria bacterium]|jgi:predicted DCC family thiol-disulfide oxidoreductase YuxK
MAEEKEKAKVYYDAECKICQLSADMLTGTKEGENFELLNVHTAQLPAEADRGKMLSEIYVSLPDGTTVKNADAILHILSAYWYMRPLVWIGRLPGCIHILRFLYGILARNRYRFGKHTPPQS